MKFLDNTQSAANFALPLLNVKLETDREGAVASISFCAVLGLSAVLLKIFLFLL
jgi:hypothetical protein